MPFSTDGKTEYLTFPVTEDPVPISQDELRTVGWSTGGDEYSTKIRGL